MKSYGPGRDFPGIYLLVDWMQGQGFQAETLDLERAGSFLHSLYEHSTHKNLTRIPPEDAWERHFVDSLLFQDLIPNLGTVLDIGTGPGFPAWPLAWARPDLAITAMDSNGKMLEFLRSHPLPNLTVLQARAEECGVEECFDVVTGRALAPLFTQLEVSATPCKLQGIVLPLRTSSDLVNIPSSVEARLGLIVEEVAHRVLPLTQAIRVAPIYRKISRTPSQFPRKWSDIKLRPL